ncbi:hypothetical protein LOK49_LG10G00584 [Camellia lanceoleosa]|uniref:Uncharacterized protein n=1 Tax=Camellia lanceoleosa TaxID=1840588 RepID=A0ACC0GA51_9ERIC|nr:hypothetical protein LOK49_LG10G00584 [Camellia lanceoleosa]
MGRLASLVHFLLFLMIILFNMFNIISVDGRGSVNGSPTVPAPGNKTVQSKGAPTFLTLIVIQSFTFILIILI